MSWPAKTGKRRNSKNRRGIKMPLEPRKIMAAAKRRAKKLKKLVRIQAVPFSNGASGIGVLELRILTGLFVCRVTRELHGLWEM
jgi:hypothetical protein